MWKHLGIFSRTRPEPKLRIIVQFFVEPDDHHFHAFSPILKGLHADGSSIDEAVRNFMAEVPAYVESVLRNGDPLPLGVLVERPDDDTVQSVEREISISCPPSLLNFGHSLET